MTTALDYAHEKFYGASILLSTCEDDTRSCLKSAFSAHVKHAHPPYTQNVPAALAERMTALFDVVMRGPKYDSDDDLISSTLDLMDDAQVQTVAAEIADISAGLAAAYRA